MTDELNGIHRGAYMLTLTLLTLLSFVLGLILGVNLILMMIGAQ